MKDIESGASGIFAEPWRILQESRRAVPAVDYALGVAGVAAAGAIVTYLIGNEQASIIILGGMLVAMVLLFAFARLVVSKSAAATHAGIVLLWAVIVFFCVFLLFTTTAVVFGWPQRLSEVLRLDVPPLTHCAPVLSDDGHLDRECNLSEAQARATAADTLEKITGMVALVLSHKDSRIFPQMEQYMDQPDEARRAALWKAVQDATTGEHGLLTTIDSASIALLELHASLRTQSGSSLARDPEGVREILESIQGEFTARASVGREIAANEKPSNELVRQWYDELKMLVSSLEKDFLDLQRKLAEPL